MHCFWEASEEAHRYWYCKMDLVTLVSVEAVVLRVPEASLEILVVVDSLGHSSSAVASV